LSSVAPLRDDIRQQLVFDFGDLVFELKLFLLQPCELHDVMQARHGIDGGIEVAVFLDQLGKLGPERNLIRSGDFTGHLFLPSGFGGRF
jgi:hypothetical protein